jgi:hypothetical protein
MSALIPIYGLAAFTAWAIVAWSSLEILARAPYGQKRATSRNLGLWNLGAIERQLGPQVHSKLLRLKWAGIAFIALVAAPIILSIAVLVLSALARKLGIA